MNSVAWAPVIAGGVILAVLVTILARGRLVQSDGTGTEKIKFGKLEVETSRLAFFFLIAAAMISLPLLLQHLKPPPAQTVTPPPKEVFPERVTLYINGEVLDSGDRGLAGAHIQVLDTNGKVVLGKDADEDGLFSFPLEVRTQGEQLTIRTFKENYFQQQFIIGPAASVKLHSVLMPRAKVAATP